MPKCPVQKWRHGIFRPDGLLIYGLYNLWNIVHGNNRSGVSNLSKTNSIGLRILNERPRAMWPGVGCVTSRWLENSKLVCVFFVYLFIWQFNLDTRVLFRPNNDETRLVCWTEIGIFFFFGFGFKIHIARARTVVDILRYCSYAIIIHGCRPRVLRG